MSRIITTLLAFLLCSSTYAAAHSDPESRSTNSNGRIKPPLDPLTLLCFSSTPGSITLTIRAGATGAPAGFSVQWMKAADLVALGGVWPADESSLCGASFFGVARCANYDLAPDAEVQIPISDDLFDACGTGSACNTPVDCNTAYVFRAFAHANNQFHRGAFSYGQWSTGPCAGAGARGCTDTQGYWKNYSNAWPVQNLTLGTINYTRLQLLEILDQPASDNGLVSLAHQLIAAKLNVASGADPSATQSAVNSADALIGTLVVPPVGNGLLSLGVTSALKNQLDNYNLGVIGPGHCP